MKNKIIIPGILFAVVALFAVVILSGEKPQPEPFYPIDTSTVSDSDIILFYGDGCPHCAIVEEFVEKNDIEDRISFTKKEVYYNRQNSSELASVAKSCGMPTDSIGVPFLWDGAKCLVGDKDIIEFFTLKASAQ